MNSRSTPITPILRAEDFLNPKTIKENTPCLISLFDREFKNRLILNSISFASSEFYLNDEYRDYRQREEMDIERLNLRDIYSSKLGKTLEEAFIPIAGNPYAKSISPGDLKPNKLEDCKTAVEGSLGNNDQKEPVGDGVLVGKKRERDEE